MLCMEAKDTQLAPTRSRRTHESGSRVLAHSVGNVPDACMFGFQDSLSGKALRKQICRISCGENPLTIRWVMLSDFWTFLFSLSPFNGHWTFFRPLSGIAPNIFLLRKAEGAAGQKRCPLTFQWTFFLRNLSHRGKYIFAAEARGTTAA